MRDKLTLTVSAKPDYIGALRVLIAAVAARMNYTIAAVEDIRTAVSEGLTMLLRGNPSTLTLEALVEEELSVSISAANAGVCSDCGANEFSVMLISAMAEAEITEEGGVISKIEMRFVR